jgi:SAM-dependent methyltransferase
MDSPQSDRSPVLNDVLTYYNQKLHEHGLTARGVDWSTDDRQQRVFEQVTKICLSPRTGVRDTGFTLLDYGCGHGSLLSYLIENSWGFERYIGFDLLPDMLAGAREVHQAHLHKLDLTDKEADLAPADYVVGVGLITVKTEANFTEWQNYALATIQRMWGLAKKGLAFNSLTKYSEPSKMKNHLYYADPGFIFDYCKNNLSRDVALLHDYGLYEFTILVRKEGSWA